MGSYLSLQYSTPWHFLQGAQHTLLQFSLLASPRRSLCPGCGPTYSTCPQQKKGHNFQPSNLAGWSGWMEDDEMMAGASTKVNRNPLGLHTATARMSSTQTRISPGHAVGFPSWKRICEGPKWAQSLRNRQIMFFLNLKCFLGMLMVWNKM